MTSVVVSNTTTVVNVAAAPTNVSAVNGVVSVVRYDTPTIQVVAVAEQGPPGSSISGVTFNQASPSAEWTINHNMGYKPAVSVRDSGGSEVEAEILHITVNQTKVYFASPQAGQAYLI